MPRLSRRVWRTQRPTKEVSWPTVTGYLYVKKADSWEFITHNIALKDGDYPGTKNVSRMRNAIIAQHNFLKQTPQTPENVKAGPQQVHHQPKKQPHVEYTEPEYSHQAEQPVYEHNEHTADNQEDFDLI